MIVKTHVYTQKVCICGGKKYKGPLRKNANEPKHKYAITVDEISDAQNAVECREY